MGLFAIGDLHLSGAVSKPMDIFGDNWSNHEKKLEDNWRSLITDSDTVLIPGDISWAMNMNEAKMDLDFIAGLPGRKVLLRGNHDYWWSSVQRLNSMYKNMSFLQNDFTEYKGIAICGSRGWALPNKTDFDDSDLKAYKREQIRYRLSLDCAIRKGYKEILFMTHFPPFVYGLESEFMEILKEYPVRNVVYGHLHGKGNFDVGIKGVRDGIDFKLVSADYLDFCPIKIFE